MNANVTRRSFIVVFVSFRITTSFHTRCAKGTLKSLPTLFGSNLCARNRNNHYSSLQGAADGWHDHPIATETSKWRNHLKKSLPFLAMEPGEWVHHLHDESFDPEKRLDTIQCQNGDNLYVVTVPKLSAAFLRSPKGFNPMDKMETKIIIDAQRLKYCDTFVRSLRGLTKKFSDDGVIFSGPNSVGKSSICLFTFLTCFVRSFPVVYIPLCDSWVAAASSALKANAYFMTTFFRQNADIIVNDPQLTPFFLDQLEDAIVREESYLEFTQALERGKIQPCGFIADEVQELTLAVTREQKHFFATDFTIWTGQSGVFTSQLCTGAYGLREVQLRSADQSRLKFVLPFEENVAKAAMREPSSPFHVPHMTDDMLERLYKAFGGMPRVIWDFASSISHAKTTTEVEERFAAFKHEQFFYYFETCVKGFINTSPDKKISMMAIHNILRGKQFFHPLVEELYEHGLCYFDPRTLQVLPVNQLAEEALQEVFSKYAREWLPPPRGTEGFLFEAWLQACILRSGCSLGASPLRMSGAGEVGGVKTLQVSFNANAVRFFPASAPFSKIPDDIKIDRDDCVLWVCSNSQYPCDGIIVPSSSRDEENNFAPIVIFEASVTNPYKSTTDKLESLKAFRAAMKEDSRFEKTDIIVILCYSDTIDAKIGTSSNYPHFYTLDQSELVKIGIKF